jgi:ABC-type branched-subunit amino acid transport system ATPase component
LPGIAAMTTPAPVTYLHLLFDHHEVVFANGAEAESLYTGTQALRALTRDARAEIFTLFPELRDSRDTPVAARPLTDGRTGRKLSARHAKNQKPIVMAS